MRLATEDRSFATSSAEGPGDGAWGLALASSVAFFIGWTGCRGQAVQLQPLVEQPQEHGAAATVVVTGTKLVVQPFGPQDVTNWPWTLSTVVCAVST